MWEMVCEATWLVEDILLLLGANAYLSPMCETGTVATAVTQARILYMSRNYVPCSRFKLDITHRYKTLNSSLATVFVRTMQVCKMACLITRYGRTTYFNPRVVARLSVLSQNSVTKRYRCIQALSRDS